MLAQTFVIHVLTGELYCGRISSVGRAPGLDCRAEGRGFDSRGRTNTQGLKITESVPSPVGDVKIVALDTQIRGNLFLFSTI